MSGNTAEAWDDAITLRIPQHLTYLEKLLREGQTFFTAVGPTAGDLAVFNIINIIFDVDPLCLYREKKYVSALSIVTPGFKDGHMEPHD